MKRVITEAIIKLNKQRVMYYKTPCLFPQIMFITMVYIPGSVV